MGGFKVAITPQEYASVLPSIKYVTGDEVLEGLVTFDSFKKLLTANLVRCPTITEDEINDKSKGDALSKGIALMQLSWFIVQIFARAAQGLEITELELTTAALAGLNGIMYFFWWSKPRDVRFPTILRTKGVEELLVAKKPEDIPCTFPVSKFCFGEHLWKTYKKESVAIGSFLLPLPGRIIRAPATFVHNVKAIYDRLTHLFSGLQSDSDSKQSSRGELGEHGSSITTGVNNTESSSSERGHGQVSSAVFV